MVLKPHDLAVAIKMTVRSRGEFAPSYRQLALELFLSVSEVYAAVKRAMQARLVVRIDSMVRVNRRNLAEFVLHGVQYSFPPTLGPPTRGTPTAYAAPPIQSLLVADQELPPVWPWAEGSARGYAFSPLYRKAPLAASKDEQFYELLALVDCIRGGKARERELARKELEKRLEIA